MALLGVVLLFTGCQADGGVQARDAATGGGSPDAAGSPASDESADASNPAAAATSGRLALFFGDSNFVGGGCSPDPRQDMAQVAGDRLGYRTAIRGEGGTGFASGNPDYGIPDYLGQIREGALAIQPAPALVVIEGGSNDTGQPLDRIARHARRVLAIARSTYPHALVVLMGPIDVRAGRTDVRPQEVATLRAAAGARGVPFLDAYAWLPWRSQGGLVCSDFDHATVAGHRIVGRTLADALRRLGA